MFIIFKKGHQPGVYVPLRALFLVVHNPLETVVKDQDMSIVYSKLTNRSHRDR